MYTRRGVMKVGALGMGGVCIPYSEAYIARQHGKNQTYG